MNIILLSIIYIAPLFGADHGWGYKSNEVARFEPAPPAPDSTFHVGLTNWSAPLSHNSMRPEIQEKMAHANKLFHSGDKPGLLKLHESLTSFGKKYTFFASDYSAQAKYVKSLINSEHLGSFIKLNEAPKSEVRTVLREIFDTTPDLSIRAEAKIAADQLVGGIFCDYGDEFQLDMTGHEPTDMMVTTRIGSYQLEKLLPQPGTKIDKAFADQFVDVVMRKAELLPEGQKSDFIKSAIESSVSAAVDPKRMTKEVLIIARETAVTIFDSFIGYHIRSKEYGEQRTQIIDGYAKEIAKAFKTYNSKDWGHLAGESAVRALYAKGMWEAGVFACGKVVGAYESMVGVEGVAIATRTPVKNALAVVPGSKVVTRNALVPVATETSLVEAASVNLAPRARIDNILSKAVRNQKTSGSMKEYTIANGTYEKALQEFHANAVKGFRELTPGKYTGKTASLGDNIQMTIRSGSSRGGPPTLEFTIPKVNGKGINVFKVRYGK